MRDHGITSRFSREQTDPTTMSRRIRSISGTQTFAKLAIVNPRVFRRHISTPYVLTTKATPALQKQIQDELSRTNGDRTLPAALKHRTSKRHLNLYDQCILLQLIDALQERATTMRDRAYCESLSGAIREAASADFWKLNDEAMMARGALAKLHLAQFRLSVFAPRGDVRFKDRLASAWILTCCLGGYVRKRILLRMIKISDFIVVVVPDILFNMFLFWWL